MAAVWIVAHVLDDEPAVGIRLRLAQLLFGGTRKTGQQERLDVRLPDCIDDGFVGEYRISVGVARTNERADEKANENCAEADIHLVCNSIRQ